MEIQIIYKTDKSMTQHYLAALQRNQYIRQTILKHCNEQRDRQLSQAAQKREKQIPATHAETKCQPNSAYSKSRTSHYEQRSIYLNSRPCLNILQCMSSSFDQNGVFDASSLCDRTHYASRQPVRAYGKLMGAELSRANTKQGDRDLNQLSLYNLSPKETSCDFIFANERSAALKQKKKQGLKFKPIFLGKNAFQVPNLDHLVPASHPSKQFTQTNKSFVINLKKKMDQNSYYLHGNFRANQEALSSSLSPQRQRPIKGTLYSSLASNQTGIDPSAKARGQDCSHHFQLNSLNIHSFSQHAQNEHLGKLSQHKIKVDI